MEEEKRRSGVKTQASIEGVGGGVAGAESGDAVETEAIDGGWMWNLRTPTFSMRYSSRAEIHFWTLYVL